MTLLKYCRLSRWFYLMYFCSQKLITTLQFIHTNARNILQPYDQSWCCTFARTRTFSKLRKGIHKKMGLMLLISCLNYCVVTVWFLEIVPQHNKLRRTSALALGHLPYSVLAQTQVACLTVTCQYFNFCCIYCALPTLFTGIDTPH